MIIEAISSVVLSIVVFMYMYNHIYRKRSFILPGPWNLPVLGYLHKLNPTYPYLTLTELAQKYGPVYRIKMGLVETVVICDAKILKKVLIKDEALERPPVYMLDLLFKGRGMTYAPVNLWKNQRKFVNNFLRTSGAAQISLKRGVLEKQIKHYVEEFTEYLETQGDVVCLNPTEALTNYVISTSSTIFLGKTFSHGDITRKILSDNYNNITHLATLGGPLNFLPFLRFLPKYKQTLSSFLKSADEILDIMSDCIKTSEKSPHNRDTCPSNLIEAFFQQKSKCNSEEIYNSEQLRFLLAEIFGASIETTANSLFWIMLYMAKFQEVQNKIRTELIKVLKNKSPQMEDLAKLPYVEAAIAEAARIRTVLPLGFPHYTTGDIQVEDFKIPNGFMIMPLLWGIHMNPKSWKKPEEFSPERFLNEDGKFRQSEDFLPFQSGKRMCAGAELGKMMIFLFIATVLKNFKIEVCGSVDLCPVCGLTLTPKPQQLILKKL